MSRLRHDGRGFGDPMAQPFLLERSLGIGQLIGSLIGGDFLGIQAEPSRPIGNLTGGDAARSTQDLGQRRVVGSQQPSEGAERIAAVPSAPRRVLISQSILKSNAGHLHPW